MGAGSGQQRCASLQSGKTLSYVIVAAPKGNILTHPHGVRARREIAGLWNATGIAQIGLLIDGCRTETNISQYLTTNTTIEVHYANSIEANGYYYVTSLDDASSDVDQWVIHSSGDNGHSWKQVCIFFMNSNHPGVSYHC
jgi:hypothetical protein